MCVCACTVKEIHISYIAKLSCTGSVFIILYWAISTTSFGKLIIVKCTALLLRPKFLLRSIKTFAIVLVCIVTWFEKVTSHIIPRCRDHFFVYYMIINLQGLFLCLVWYYSNYSHYPRWGVVTAAVESLWVSAVFRTAVEALVLLETVETTSIRKS